jgi:hypothetical protein
MIVIGPFVNQIWWYIRAYMQARMLAILPPTLPAAATMKQENMSPHLRISAHEHRSIRVQVWVIYKSTFRKSLEKIHSTKICCEWKKSVLLVVFFPILQLQKDTVIKLHPWSHWQLEGGLVFPHTKKKDCTINDITFLEHYKKFVASLKFIIRIRPAILGILQTQKKGTLFLLFNW